MAHESGATDSVLCEALDAASERFALYDLHVLNNACKFTCGGDIVVTAARRDDGERIWLTIAIADTGNGMTAEQVADVFGLFV